MAKLPAPLVQRQVAADPVGGMAGTPDVSSHLVDFGNWLGAYADKLKTKNDNTQVEEAYNKLLDKQNELTLGEKGFTHLRGGDAVRGEGAFIKEYGTQWQGVFDEVGKGLSADQMQAFKLRAMAARREFTGNMMKHYASQTTEYQQDTFNASMDNVHNEMAQGWTNPAVRNGLYARTRSLAEDMADTKGYPPGSEPYKDFMRDQMSSVHASAIQAALDAEQTDFAQQYLDEHVKKGEINEDVESKARDLLKRVGVKKKAFEAADRLWSKHGSVVAARDELAKLSPEVRDQASAIMRQYASDQRAEKTRAEEAERDYVLDLGDRMIDEGLSIVEILEQEKLSDRISNPQNMTYLMDLSEKLQPGETRVDDPRLVLESQTLTDPELSKMSVNDVLRYQDGMSDQTFKEFYKRWGKAKRGESTGESGGAAASKTHLKIIDDVTEHLPKDERDPATGLTERESARRLLASQYNMLSQMKAKNGELVTEEDVNRLVDAYYAPRRVYASENRWADQLEYKPIAELTMDNIPDDVSDAMRVDIAKRRGVDPDYITDEEIVRDHQQWLLERDVREEEVKYTTFADIPLNYRQEIAAELVKQGKMPDDEGLRELRILDAYKMALTNQIRGQQYRTR